MHLTTSRLGLSFLGDRLLVTPSNGTTAGVIIKKGNSWQDWLIRIFSWIYSPESYTQENRKTIHCFKNFLSTQIGAARLSRICSRYGVDFDSIEKKGSPLLARDIEKICTGVLDVKTEDLEEAIALARQEPSQWPIYLSDKLRSTLRDVSYAEELPAQNFSEAYRELQAAAHSFSLPEIKNINGGAPTQFFASFFFNQFLADRERLTLQKGHSDNDFESFVHNFSVSIIRREPEVGMLVPAPRNSINGNLQFYRIAARLITGEGNVSYCLVPATLDTDLKPIQFYRGTAPYPSAIDAAGSIIADLAKEIGSTAWDSGAIYRPLLKAFLPKMEIVCGHSLGSVLSQHDLVENTSIRKAYLFNGPGISAASVKRFNERMQRADSDRVELIIRDADRDDLSAMGEMHIGCGAPPEKVSIDYRKYFSQSNVYRSAVHTTIWSRTNQLHGLTSSNDRALIDRDLHHKNPLDRFRETVGPHFAKIFRVVRDFFRWIFGARTWSMQGLEVGRYERSTWKMRTIRPMQVTEALYEALART